MVTPFWSASIGPNVPVRNVSVKELGSGVSGSAGSGGLRLCRKVSGFVAEKLRKIWAGLSGTDGPVRLSGP